MILERLDRGLCNSGWKNLFPNSKIRPLDFWGFDHRPLIIEIMKDVSSRNDGWNNIRSRRFYFEECWIDENDCKDIVVSVWDWNQRVARIPEVLRNLSSCGNLLNE